MCKLRRSLFLSLLILSSLQLIAQDDTDFGWWATASYGTEVIDDLDFTLDQEFRFEDNGQRLGRAFTSLGLDYKLNRAVRVGINYRFILNRRDQGYYGHRHRIMADLQLRQQYQRWTWAYRARAQWEVRTWNYPNEFGFTSSNDLRNTLKTVFQINRQYEVYGSFDLRILNFDPNVPGFSGIDRFRYRVGTDVLVARDQSIGFFFQYQNEVAIPEAEREFVIGIEFKFGSRRPLIQS